MSKQQPNRPARPESVPTKRPTRPAQDSPADASQQQAMRAKGQTAQAEEDDEDEYEEEDSVMTEWLRQSPSWLASMVFHMILLLVLALWALPDEMKEEFKEIVLGKPEIAEEEELEEEDNEMLNETLESEFVSENQEVVQDIVATEDFEVESPVTEIPNAADDMQLAAAKIEFNEFAMQSAVSGNLLSDLGGIASSGLGGRSARGRSAAVRAGGGNKASESSVEAALKWLAAHQNRDGSWSWNHTPGDGCSGYANPGEKKSKMGATGLALLPFLGAGYTHKDGKYQETVRKGVKYLVGNMIVANNAGRLFEADGSSHEHMYCHGIAACALAEAFGMTNDYQLQAPAQLSLNYIIQAQHPENGGWLYTPRAGGDTSVVGWQVMALKSGVLSHLNVPGKVKSLANKWLDFVQWGTPEDGYGIGPWYGYRKPDDRPQASPTTAIGLLCRNYLGAQKHDPGLQKGVATLAKSGPSLKGNMYYNYYAAQVMYQNDGPDGAAWKKFNSALRDFLVNSQVKNGDDVGSWFFTGGHGGKSGGRVYCTAMAAMTLEVYYRYLPVYQQGNVAKDDFPLE